MMDDLHGVLRTLQPENKSGEARNSRAADHLSVFREFISHLDRMSRQAAAKTSRVKAQPSRTQKRKPKR